MSTEDSPVSNAQPLQVGFANLTAKNRIGIHRCHQDGRILIVFCLFGCKAVEIDINITGKGDIVLIIDQNDLTGQMTALAFINLKVQIAKLKKADLG